jgi:multisubunit Na+/H+ antiporter MnhC subunit
VAVINLSSTRKRPLTKASYDLVGECGWKPCDESRSPSATTGSALVITAVVIGRALFVHQLSGELRAKAFRPTS